MEEKSISYEMKVMYVIGSLLIISGHFGSYLLSFRYVFVYDTFHVPLFFFASGYLFKKRHLESPAALGSYLWKKVRRLVIPYYLWAVVYLLLAFLLNRFTALDIPGSIHSVSDFFFEPILIGHGSEYNVAAWFLLALFVVEAVYACFRFVLLRCGLTAEWVPVLLLLALAAALISLSKAGVFIPARRFVVRTGYLLFWFAAGSFYHAVLEKPARRWNNWLMFLLYGAVAVLLRRTVEQGTDVRSYVFTAEFRPAVFYVFVRAALGIAFWLRLCYLVTPWLKNRKWLLYFSSHTFSVMMHQGLAGVAVNSVVRLLFPSAVDDSMFFHEIWYGMNRVPDICRFVYVIFVPALILLCVSLYDRCRNRLFPPRNRTSSPESTAFPPNEPAR